MKKESPGRMRGGVSRGKGDEDGSGKVLPEDIALSLLGQGDSWLSQKKKITCACCH